MRLYVYFAEVDVVSVIALVRSSLKADLQLSQFVRSVPEADIDNISMALKKGSRTISRERLCWLCYF